MALFAGGGITARNAFLEEHAQIARMPRTQRDWVGFIQALQRWSPEYEGTVDMVSAGIDSTPTFTGVLYYRYGKLVIIEFPVQEGTSNSTSLFSLTSLPTRIRPTRNQIVPCPGLVDNGTPVSQCGQALVKTDGVIAFGLDNNSGGWTGSGQKGFGDVAGNCIIYSLHDAKKID